MGRRRLCRSVVHQATLDGWVMRVGELLGPVVTAMRLDLLRRSYLQADETIVPVALAFPSVRCPRASQRTRFHRSGLSSAPSTPGITRVAEAGLREMARDVR